MNFHTNPIPGYVYVGDVNLEHGGTFYEDKSAEFEAARAEKKTYREYIPFVQVSEVNEMDNQWAITQGALGVLICFNSWDDFKGKTFYDLLCDDAWHKGLDHEYTYIVQIGKLDEYQSSNPAKADKVYRGNKRLHNIVKEYM